MLGLLITTWPGAHALAQADSGEVRGRVQNTYRSTVALIPITWCRGAVAGTTDLTGAYRPSRSCWPLCAYDRRRALALLRDS